MATLKRHHRVSKCESTSKSYFSWNKLKKYSKILILTYADPCSRYAYCLDVVLKHFSPCFDSVLVRHLLSSLLLIGVSHCFRTALPLHMWKFSLYLWWVGLKGSPVYVPQLTRRLAVWDGRRRGGETGCRLVLLLHLWRRGRRLPRPDASTRQNPQPEHLVGRQLFGVQVGVSQEWREYCRGCRTFLNSLSNNPDVDFILILV